MHGLLTSWVLRSPLGRAGERLWRRNEADFLMPLTKLQKLLVTVYLVAKDSRDGRFPPRPVDSIDEAHAREREYLDRLAGATREEMDRMGLRKPFWGGKDMRRMLLDLCRIDGLLRMAGGAPRSRVLELGCGSGWASELLARRGYDVLGTTLDPQTVDVASRRSMPSSSTRRCTMPTTGARRSPKPRSSCGLAACWSSPTSRTASTPSSPTAWRG